MTSKQIQSCYVLRDKPTKHNKFMCKFCDHVPSNLLVFRGYVCECQLNEAVI